MSKSGLDKEIEELVKSVLSDNSWGANINQRNDLATLLYKVISQAVQEAQKDQLKKIREDLMVAGLLSPAIEEVILEDSIPDPNNSELKSKLDNLDNHLNGGKK